MFTIGDFATHGSVSVRMLRHYDAVGLLRPARVDAVSGYRYYAAGQLARLNRIIALKGLGLTLEQVREILDEKIDVGELRGMLRLREAELEASMSADAARLAQVGERLRMIESEGRMSSEDIVTKRITPVRVAELTGTADRAAPESIGPVIQPLYDELFARLERAGVTPVGAGLAYYEQGSEGEDSVVVHAAVQVGPDVGRAGARGAGAGTYDFSVVDLPEVPVAATIVHRGSMDGVMASLQTLARWIESNGYRSVGHPRELHLACEGGPENWVTEIQEPVVRA